VNDAVIEVAVPEQRFGAPTPGDGLFVALVFPGEDERIPVRHPTERMVLNIRGRHLLPFPHDLSIPIDLLHDAGGPSKPQGSSVEFSPSEEISIGQKFCIKPGIVWGYPLMNDISFHVSGETD